MFVLRTSGAFLMTTMLVSAPAFAQPPTPAGHVKIATGHSFIVRQNTTIAAKPGDAVFAIDTSGDSHDAGIRIHGTTGAPLDDYTDVFRQIVGDRVPCGHILVSRRPNLSLMQTCARPGLRISGRVSCSVFERRAPSSSRRCW